MKIHFFSAKNIEDYRKVYCEHMDKLKIGDETLEDFDQRMLFFNITDLFKVPQKILESVIYGETGIDGLRLDFNFGLRLDVPEGSFHVTISDDNGQIFFDRDISGVRLISVEKYFIRWRVEIFLDGAKIFNHTLNLDGQKVFLNFDKRNGLGDILALLPSIGAFKQKFNCAVSISLPEHMREFAASIYPEITQVDANSFDNYATYFYKMYGGDFPFCKADFRRVPLNHMANYIVGLEALPIKPPFKPTVPPVTDAPYVCISVQASTPLKGWLYPGGWKLIVDYLKSLGYRVFCIDKKNLQREGNYSVAMPNNAEDFTGDFSIMERANMLYHAEFFIGLSSGLSWLADFVNCPVVMICGFSQDWFEFYTPYRVANRLLCNGCFNDVRVSFIHNVCPYHEGTARELECQKKIFPSQVIDAINRLILDKNLTPPILRSGKF